MHTHTGTQHDAAPTVTAWRTPSRVPVRQAFDGHSPAGAPAPAPSSAHACGAGACRGGGGRARGHSQCGAVGADGYTAGILELCSTDRLRGPCAVRRPVGRTCQRGNKPGARIDLPDSVVRNIAHVPARPWADAYTGTQHDAAPTVTAWRTPLPSRAHARLRLARGTLLLPVRQAFDGHSPRVHPHLLPRVRTRVVEVRAGAEAGVHEATHTLAPSGLTVKPPKLSWSPNLVTPNDPLVLEPS